MTIINDTFNLNMFLITKTPLAGQYTPVHLFWKKDNGINPLKLCEMEG